MATMASDAMETLETDNDTVNFDAPNLNISALARMDKYLDRPSHLYVKMRFLTNSDQPRIPTSRQVMKVLDRMAIERASASLMYNAWYIGFQDNDDAAFRLIGELTLRVEELAKLLKEHENEDDVPGSV